MPPRLTFRRSDNDTATDIGYVLDDGGYAAIRVADDSDTATVAGQFRALAARIHPSGEEPRVTPGKRRARRRSPWWPDSKQPGITRAASLPAANPALLGWHRI